ncbi:MAG TPA: copper homeostasis protein CutC [Eudoraea sp.]|nr:copper homeostasis protein CutC [Eudoraea sp.]
MLVEVCANSLESARVAEKSGADRIELCSELAVGGITPSFGLLKKVKEALSIPVHVLIRPRSGGFTYSALEFEIMKEDIGLCRDMGFQGIVAGVLHSDFTLDEVRTRELVQLAGDLAFTFHRAMDWVKNPLLTLSKLEEMGVGCILSSGGQGRAVDGLPVLESLNKKNSRCTIMPGGGINEHNVATFKNKGFKAVHLSGTKFHRSLGRIPPVPMNAPAFLREDSVAISNQEVLRKIVQIVK